MSITAARTIQKLSCAPRSRRRIDHLGAGGGYVVAAVHNIQTDVPPENIAAMCEAALEFGRY